MKCEKAIGLAIVMAMLSFAPAWADVDISGKEKVEVGTWAELKAAVQSSANVGKVIVLTANIQADVNTPITSVGGEGIIIDGGGHTITGTEGSSGKGQFINFDSSDQTDLIIQNVNLKGFVVKTSSAHGGAIYNTGTINNINGDFTSNSVQGSSSAEGGAIFNDGGTIGDISGDFESNSAQSDSSSAYGGAIFNDRGTIGDISGDFTSNSAQSTSSYAYGGAIFNQGSALTLVNSNFKDNYVQTGAEKDSIEGQMTFGGAIASLGDLTIQADKGESIFSGNKVKWADGEESSAITLMSTSSPLKLTLDSRNQGLIQFDDKISSLGSLDAMLL